jgi:hypothetical protein
MTEVFPPYFSHYEDTSFYPLGDAEFSQGLDANADINSGGIININQNRIQYPGDSASQKTYTNSTMQILFQSPVSGQVTIVATVVCGIYGADTYYHGSLEDESGWSNASITQRSYLGMMIPGVIDGNYVAYPLFSYNRGDDEGNWYSKIAEWGEVIQVRYVPNISFTAGESRLLEISIWDEQNAWVNDMEFYGIIENRWVIRKVDVT